MLWPMDLLEATADVATPALVVDLAAAERNIARAASLVAGSRARLRPHFKAHKCTRLLALQVAGGDCAGVTCATAWEAEVLARAGFEDVLVANEVADLGAVEALRRAAGVGARVTVCVDDPRHLELLAEVDVEVLVEV